MPTSKRPLRKKDGANIIPKFNKKTHKKYVAFFQDILQCDSKKKKLLQHVLEALQVAGIWDVNDDAFTPHKVIVAGLHPDKLNVVLEKAKKFATQEELTELQDLWKIFEIDYYPKLQAQVKSKYGYTWEAVDKRDEDEEFAPNAGPSRRDRRDGDETDEDAMEISDDGPSRPKGPAFLIQDPQKQLLEMNFMTLHEVYDNLQRRKATKELRTWNTDAAVQKLVRAVTEQTNAAIAKEGTNLIGNKSRLGAFPTLAYGDLMVAYLKDEIDLAEHQRRATELWKEWQFPKGWIELPPRNKGKYPTQSEVDEMYDDPDDPATNAASGAESNDDSEYEEVPILRENLKDKYESSGHSKGKSQSQSLKRRRGGDKKGKAKQAEDSDKDQSNNHNDDDNAGSSSNNSNGNSDRHDPDGDVSDVGNNNGEDTEEHAMPKDSDDDDGSDDSNDSEDSDDSDDSDDSNDSDSSDDNDMYGSRNRMTVSIHSRPRTVEVRPNRTDDGKRIVGWQEYERTMFESSDKSVSLTRRLYVVKTGKDKYELRDESECGGRAVWRQLDQDKIMKIGANLKTLPRNGVITEYGWGINWVAMQSEISTTPTRLPRTVCCVWWKKTRDGSNVKELLWRSDVHKLVSKKEADRMIARCMTPNGKKCRPIWDTLRRQNPRLMPAGSLNYNSRQIDYRPIEERNPVEQKNEISPSKDTKKEKGKGKQKESKSSTNQRLAELEDKLERLTLMLEKNLTSKRR